MEKVPIDIVLDIFIKASSLREVVNLAQVNKALAQILRENKHYICKKRLEYHFDGLVAPQGQECVFLKVAESIPKGTNLNMYLLKKTMRGCTTEVLVSIFMGADIHFDNDRALWYAAQYGHTETVKLLLEHGADVHAEEDKALYTAAIEGHVAIVKLLLEHGANIHIGNDAVLNWAVVLRRPELVKLLLEHGANLHAGNDETLRHAVRKGYTEIVKLLLEYGANVHIEDEYALRYAIIKGYTEIVKLLLEYGADADNPHVLNCADKSENTDIKDLLRKYSAH